MLPWETLRARDDRRARRRTDLAPLEQLEGRQLMAYSALGYSLPDLRVSGQAGPVAAWGSTYRVNIILQNIGASTMNEPLALAPTSQVVLGPDGLPVPPYALPGSADASSSQVGVYLSPRPHSMAGAIKIGTVQMPALAQNDVEQFESPIVLPQKPAGFPATGVMYLRLVANDNNAVLEMNTSNNVSGPIPVRFVSRALPMLRVTALDVPPVIQPGDSIAPTFQITNFGTAGTNTQGPVEVALVASVSPDFNLGSSIVALYTMPSGIPGQSSAPVSTPGARHRRLFGSRLYNESINPGRNMLTFTAPAVTLPASPGVYYLGIVVDPNNTLNQLSLPANRLEQIHKVGPAVPGLPPAGVLSAPLSQPFPNPPDGQPIGSVNPATI